MHFNARQPSENTILNLIASFQSEGSVNDYTKKHKNKFAAANIECVSDSVLEDLEISILEKTNLSSISFAVSIQNSNGARNSTSRSRTKTKIINRIVGAILILFKMPFGLHKETKFIYLYSRSFINYKCILCEIYRSILESVFEE